MATRLNGKKVAFIATNGFEPSELQDPLNALREAGAECVMLSDQSEPIRGWKNGWTSEVAVDAQLGSVSSDEFDALVIPGGTLNSDKIRCNKEAISFVKEMFEAKKPISAICHGPQLLIEAGVLEGRRVTSYHAIKTDVSNAGAEWVDEEVVVDQGLTTSRSPEDIPAFISKTIEEIGEGRHRAR